MFKLTAMQEPFLPIYDFNDIPTDAEVALERVETRLAHDMDELFFKHINGTHTPKVEFVEDPIQVAPPQGIFSIPKDTKIEPLKLNNAFPGIVPHATSDDCSCDHCRFHRYIQNGSQP